MRKLTQLIVLCVACTVIAGCPFFGGPSEENMPPTITGATILPSTDEIVLYGTFPTYNKSGTDLIVQLSDNTPVTADFKLVSYATNTIRIAVPRTATGILRVRNNYSESKQVSNPVHLTSWTGAITVFNEFTTQLPSTSSLATKGVYALHFRGIIDPQLTQKSIAVTLDTKTDLFATGTHVDPAGGSRAVESVYSWSLRGASNIAMDANTVDRKAVAGLDAASNIGVLTKIHARFTALVSDGILTTIVNGGTSISPFTLDSFSFDFDLASDYRIDSNGEINSGSGITRSTSWPKMIPTYPPGS